MTEEWRPVQLGRFRSSAGYEVSNLGRIRRRETGRILKPYPCPTRNGVYLKVDLRQNGRRYQCFVHRLVAREFIPNPAHKPEVNHLDTHNSHNQADNLEWVTRSENEMHKRFMEATA